MIIPTIDFVFLCFLYFFFSLYVICDFVRDINNDQKIKTFSYIKIFYFISYCVTPILSIIFYSPSTLSYKYISTNVKYFYLSYLISIVFYLLLKKSYDLLKKVKVNDNKANYQLNINSTRFLMVSFMFLIIGSLSVYLWVKVYGYPFGMFKYASSIRSGIITIYNKYTFLKPLCYFSIISSYAFFLCLLSRKNTIVSLLCFLFAVFNSFVLIISNDGRMLILIYVLTFILFYINKNIKLNLKNIIGIILVGIVSIILLGQSNDILRYVKGTKRLGDSENNIFKTVGDEFSFVHMNNINVLYLKENNALSTSTEINDIKNVFLAWIPERFKENSKNLFDINTSNYYNISGQIPTDAITASIYKFGFFGILILPFVISIIAFLIERFFSKYDSIFMSFIYNLVGVYFGLRVIAYYDLSVIIFGCFYIIIGLIVYCLFCRERNV